MRVRDHYFAAWAIERGVAHTISAGVVSLSIDSKTMRELQAEYSATHKPVFDRVKKIIQTINAARRV